MMLLPVIKAKAGRVATVAVDKEAAAGADVVGVPLVRRE